MGNPEHAARLAEEARQLDTADRNLNFESVKYQLKNNDVEKAHELMGLFSYEVWKGLDLNVHEMQTMWFEFHCSNAHYRKKEFRQSLKQIGWIEKHFDTMVEDCLEFNNYALRKGTVNHEVQMIHFIHDIYNGHYPSKCCINTVKGVLKVLNLSAEELGKFREEYETEK
jgi:peptide alpha-N-acetyltransferase